MRARNKPWAEDHLKAHPQYVPAEPESHKGKWKADVFGNHNELHIEVGSGKGRFITEMAKMHPDVNYIAIELSESIAISALDRMIEADIPNVKLLTINAEILGDVFERGEVDRVYLNFSDPWPKTRHEKRRLTFKKFLDLYKTVLPENGEIHFKTDNRGLFEYSLQSFSAYGLLLTYVSLDLHNSDFEGNVMTEYEEKFSSMGQSIYRCEVRYQ
ncbi:tRNA (guanosine(46)-N7)-methyltransferase TrmB [Jeotgalibacillus haloalkalitolerans]|uniref:tRNA (guanine-N(7)-)-methyltransferase n=1 Tax=Jeotgalibacillus haloalkalitolerans TaxID=3104292 RepID=A0ABU5KMN6_9BACL|nr:tRNA (guanosine(46)-N7)-methyltransferase TrmB [Jeotgalibacillus sp. HH7-29]MDZ5712520.1 tRNA (guanosine(46)-N7)-methyltransferase TrmB [Jeotgalibacillus sp. HH7-29]